MQTDQDHAKRTFERNRVTPGQWIGVGGVGLGLAAAATAIASAPTDLVASGWAFFAVVAGLAAAAAVRAAVRDVTRSRPFSWTSFPLAFGFVFLTPDLLLAIDLVAGIATGLVAGVTVGGLRRRAALQWALAHSIAVAVGVAAYTLTLGSAAPASGRVLLALTVGLVATGGVQAIAIQLDGRFGFIELPVDAAEGASRPLPLVAELSMWTTGGAIGALAVHFTTTSSAAAWFGGVGYLALLSGGLLAAELHGRARLESALTVLQHTLLSSTTGEVAAEVAPLVRTVLEADAVVVVDGPEGAAWDIERLAADETEYDSIVEALHAFADDLRAQSGALTVHLETLRGRLAAIRQRPTKVRWAHVPCATGFTGAVVVIGPEPLLSQGNRQRFLDRAAAGVGTAAAAARKLASFEHRARFDALTGLPSRSHVEEQIEEALAAADPETRHAVVLVDLNGFKEVNDTLGHHVGDIVLAEVGGRIGAFSDRTRAIGRIGGDEFALLLEGPPAELRTTVEEVTNDLADAVSSPIAHGDLVLDLSISAGAAFSPEHGTAADDLIRAADVAMYAAKNQNVRLRTYEGSLDRHRSRRLGLATDLRAALAAEDLRVVFQPKVSFDTGELMGAEALIRWSHPTLGGMPAGEIISIAEHAGILREITDYVLERAARLAAQLRDEGIDLAVAVNLTERDIADPALPTRVADTLERHRLTTDHLSLEVTETALLTQEVEALGILPKLAESGIKIAIDDFGTGFSSLSHLRRFPVDEIKIDMSFVERIVIRENDALIVRSIVQLGHSLGMRVVAEGVETSEAWTTLAGFGTDIAQGNHVMRAVDPTSFRSWALFWRDNRLDRNVLNGSDLASAADAIELLDEPMLRSVGSDEKELRVAQTR